MPDTQEMIAAEALVEPARDEGIDLEVHTEDSVPVRLNPVFISLGLPRESFVEQTGSTSVPAIDLTTVDGQLAAFAALGFQPGPDTVGWHTPPHRRAAAAFCQANPLPPRGPGERSRLERFASPISDERLLRLLQAKLTEAGIPFRLGNVTPPTERRPQLFLIEHYQLASFRGDLARDEMVCSIPPIEPHTTITYKLITKKRTS
jgi:hypothetical protein